MDCLFCKIASGEIPANILYEDGDVVAFLDIRPVNPGHTLVIPKQHAHDIFDIRPEAYAAVSKTAQKMAHAISKALSPDGVNIHMNNKPAAGQVIFHAHVHVIPRFENDGYKMWHGRDIGNEETTREIQQKIREAL